VWRYSLLLEVQALLVPDEVRRLLHLDDNKLISGLVQTYRIIRTGNLRTLVHSLLIPPRYWDDVRKFDRSRPISPNLKNTKTFNGRYKV